jgi:hypothetical protein
MKCPFCAAPCGNEHCPYYEKEEEDTENKGLKEENARLKETIKQLQEWIINKQ